VKIPAGLRIGISLVGLIALVVAGSAVSDRLWQREAKTAPASRPLALRPEMTIAEFGQENALARPVLRDAFGLRSPADLEQRLAELPLSDAEIRERVGRSAALEAEGAAKNWLKIVVKFGLWFVFLGAVLGLLRRGRVTSRGRRWLYGAAVGIFGVVLGADPAPMGTVKDAIVLYGNSGAIFPPRMIALAVFLLLVLLANKFICSWGCQAGALQDLVFRLNRNRSDTGGLLPQYKPPFALTNVVRVTFFAFFTWLALASGTDVIHPVDPFRVYKPATLGLLGAASVGVVLVASLFVYRPWCHLFCPFGLVGWVVEKVSLFKIAVDYETCTACGACENACPSTVMAGILRRDRVIPDCFSCGTCVTACPTGSIHLRRGRRGMPPPEKFRKR
jgi:NAD-dependent dihydropyrimidine dehydrogenase PreA subunit